VLQAIASVQDILLHEGTDPKHAALLEDVNMVTNIGVVLLNDLLDLSRVEASVLKLELKPMEFRFAACSIIFAQCSLSFVIGCGSRVYYL